MSFEDLTLKDSSSIAAAAYARAHHLQAGRGTVVEGFLDAESHGQFINWRIKPNYCVREVT
jgi:hypothetical protein